MAGTWLYPYTTFIAQIAALGAAAVVAAVYLRPRLDRDGLLVTTAVVVAVVVAAAGVARLWDSLRGGDESRDALAAPAGITYREICLTEGENANRVAYARWANRTLPPDVVYEAPNDPCLGFQLLPRTPRRPGGQAAWRLYPEALPRHLARRAREEAGLPFDQRTVLVAPGGGGAERLRPR